MKISPKKLILIIVVIVLVIGAVAGLFFIMDYQKKQTLAKNPKLAKEADTKELVEKVGKLIKLPNETPSIATVSDISKLQNQTLFQNAQNGDKVLIFNQAKRAIVYRPSENVIVEIGNVVVAPESTPSGSPEEAKKVSVVLLNATPTAGYAKKVGNDLVSENPNIEVAGTSNANGVYTKNTIYVIKPSRAADDLAKSIATSIDGEVGKTLPSDEDKPANADILIILGK
jgi:uncharacterized protein YneF (UPF0154 family)